MQQHGVDELDDQYAAEPEQHQIADPDPSVQVHGLFAVIPPARVKALLEEVAGQVLEHPAQHERDREGRAVAGLEAGQQPDDDGDECGAAAVDGQDGAGQKAAVDKAVKFLVFERHLDAPAEEGIGEKQQHKIDRLLHAKTTFQFKQIKRKRPAWGVSICNIAGDSDTAQVVSAPS